MDDNSLIEELPQRKLELELNPNIPLTAGIFVIMATVWVSTGLSIIVNINAQILGLLMLLRGHP